MRYRTTRLLIVALSMFAASAAFAGQTGSPVVRLNQIAYDLTHNLNQDPTSELTEACKLMGFGIWKDGVPFGPQTSDSPLHLAVTQGEIRDYGQLSRRNAMVKLSDLESGFDDLVTKLGAKVSVSSAVNAFLSDSGYSSKKPVFYLQTFLHALSMNHIMSPSSSFTPDSQLDMIQSLLLMRVISEDIATPVRKRLQQHKAEMESLAFSHSIFPGLIPEEPLPTWQAGQPSQLPGWAEDLYVGTIGQIYGAIDSWEGQPGSAGSQFVNSLNWFNGAMSLIKFISAYVKLEGDIEMTPGAPLVRTTDTLEQGALATLKATFKINGDPTSQTMQDLRKYLALVGGMDLGQPTEAPLKGVETEWKIGQSTKYATKQVIETQRGKSVNLAKVVTDDNGTASVPIAGKPQFQEIDKNTAQSVTKHILISVTPQVASNNVLSDTINIALGIKSGPIGMLSVVEGFVQHMKWTGTVNYDLQVTDWVPGDVFGTVTAELSASYSDPNVTDGAAQQTINHTLKIETAKLKVLETSQTPNLPGLQSLQNLPPAALNQLSDAQKQMLADAMAKANNALANANSGAAAQAGKAPKILHYMVAFDSGTYSMKVNDSAYKTLLPQHGGEATHGTIHQTDDSAGSTDGEYDGKVSTAPSFELFVNQTEGYVQLAINAACPCNSRYTYSDSDQPSMNADKTSTGNVALVSGVELPPDVQKNGFRFPLKANNTADGGLGGSITVPCTFHGASANLILSFSLTAKKKPTTGGK